MIGLGIGDLHYDGPLSKYIPDLNQVITEEVDSVICANLRNGIEFVVLYGDLGHKSILSDDAKTQLLSIVARYPKIQFFFLKGNHDEDDAGHCGLDIIKKLSTWFIPNLKVITRKSTTVLDGKLRLCPWPNVDVKVGPLNVLHIEVAGSRMDTGREYNVDLKLSSRAQCVSGHLHTAQRASNVDYSGTLYQTSFGEQPKKYYHLITLNDEGKHTVERVRHNPKYTLVNLVVNTQQDLESIESDPFKLYKLFVQSDVVLDDRIDMPNVVKTNKYSTKSELKALMQEELILDDASDAIKVDHESMLDEWLKQKQIDPSMAERVLAKNKQLLESIR